MFKARNFRIQMKFTTFPNLREAAFLGSTYFLAVRHFLLYIKFIHFLTSRNIEFRRKNFRIFLRSLQMSFCLTFAIHIFCKLCCQENVNAPLDESGLSFCQIENNVDRYSLYFLWVVFNFRF